MLKDTGIHVKGELARKHKLQGVSTGDIGAL